VLFCLLPLLTRLLLLLLLLCCLLCCVVTSLPVASPVGATPALLPHFICFFTYAIVQRVCCRARAAVCGSAAMALPPCWQSNMMLAAPALNCCWQPVDCFLT
jgi:hypothetical protein